MKRSILLFTAIAGIGYLTLTSYSTGPGGSLDNLYVNGDPNSSGTCSQTNCHGSLTTAGTTLIQLKDPTTGANAGSSYVPNKMYQVVISGSLAGASKYGFQLTTLKSDHTQTGAFSSTTPSQWNYVILNGVQVMEHKMPLTAMLATFFWTAPGSGTGNVTFYSAINGTNGNGEADADDHPFTSATVFSEGTASVASLSKNIRITAYPNPVSTFVNLKFEDAERGIYTVTVMDITGRKVHTELLSVSGTDAGMTIQTGNWTSGLHFAQVMKDGAQRMIPVVKQ